MNHLWTGVRFISRNRTFKKFERGSFMIDYRLGYEYYRKVCEEHKVIPINYHYYLLNLSQEQLDAYNEQAVKQGGALEYELR